MALFGGIEAGGTKFVCALGSGPGDVETIEFPTTTPAETVERAAAFLISRAERPLAIGIGSFGPVDLDPQSPTCGYITDTPKELWRHFDFAGSIRSATGMPVVFDTDVNAAAFGEHRWGAARGLDTFLYVTVGTGIGGGGMANGKPMHGRMHPEMGHVRIPHDWTADPYAGSCPYHGDCLEGLACGPAMEARWGLRAEKLPYGHSAWSLEAHYLALGLVNWIFTVSPQQIIVGGGVMRNAALYTLIRREVAELIHGYLNPPEIVAPLLGDRAGVLGAIALADSEFR
jgi:fructokinase